MKRSEQRVPTPGLLELFVTFLGLGATAFGGLAVIEYFRRATSLRRRWIDEPTFNYGVAISQAIPGPPTAKMATYIGLRARGPAGAAAVIISYIIPTFVLMVALSALYERVYQAHVTRAIFQGLQVVILAVVVDAIFRIGKTSTRTWRQALIALISAGLFLTRLNPIFVILAATAIGLLIYDQEPFKDIRLGPTGSRYPYRAVIALVTIPILALAALFIIDRRLFTLSASMFRIGLFSFGGGFGAIPLMFHDAVEKYKWLDAPTLLNGIALGQITPGPISITATFIGYKVAGYAGATAATIAIFYPTLLLTVAVVPYFDKLTGSKYFNKAVGGILCSFVGLFLSVAYRFATQVHWNLTTILLASAAFLAMRINIEIIFVVIAGAIISILIF